MLVFGFFFIKKNGRNSHRVRESVDVSMGQVKTVSHLAVSLEKRIVVNKRF